MKVTFILDTPLAYNSGIWWHRNQIPSEALNKRGHAVKQISMASSFNEEQLNWPDVVVFGRAYAQVHDPVKWMKEWKKRGKRVIYDMDDDYWNVEKHNPSAIVSNALKDQYEGMIKEADAIITTSEVLKKKFKKFKKPVFICPNGVNEEYTMRPFNDDILKVGYMGAASHWKDLQIIGKVISDLQQKHEFLFVIYGLTGEPLEAAFYSYRRLLQNNLFPEKNETYKEALAFEETLKHARMFHIPFMPPELHGKTLSACDFDIGLAPLEDSVFNSGKSNIKFYEYAAVGTVTLASDVLPYSEEVGYCAKNNYKDWYKKLEKLIVDEKFRKDLLAKQQKFVSEHRTTNSIGLPWELALQQPGGLKVKMQEQ